MLNAVDHCHKNGYVHRDIKLENILLDEEKNTIKLADFGVVASSEAKNLNGV